MYELGGIDYATQGGIELLREDVESIKTEIKEYEEAIVLFREILNNEARNGEYRTKCKEVIVDHTNRGEDLCKELIRLESLLLNCSTKLNNELKEDQS